MLFAELEATPPRRRNSQDFKDRDRQLARLLGLHDEFFFSCCSVLDREAAPCWPEEYPAHAAWHRCRAVRRQLLEVTKSEPRKPEGETGRGA